ncbi:MAG: hypothetical protein QME57_05475 [Patescibacteria group bacterium]|nr:hypothetical protein [Patescibacteria group bacterium]
MNNQKGLAPIVIVLIIIVFLGGGIFTWKYFSIPKEETGMPKEEGIPSLNNTAECNKAGIPIEEIVTGPFRSINEFIFAGEATLSGYVVTKKEEFFEEEIERVYLKISPQKGDTPQARFYSYFVRMVERGNMVNLIENDDLLFRLGELKDNGNTLSSTANISPLAETKILSVLKTTEIISLRIQVPVWVAMGASSDFSFACAVEFSGD